MEKIKVYILDGLSNHISDSILISRFERTFSTKKLSLIILMTAISLASSYAMIGIPNVNLMDLFVFISGYLMGAFSGIIVGVLTWLVYGTLNPLGFNLAILAATCLGESLYGFVGGLSAKLGLGLGLSSVKVEDKMLWWVNLKFGIIGFLLTFIYDLFTNIVSGLIVNIPPFIAIMQGIPFAVAHEVSNFFFFFFGCSALIVSIRKILLKGGENL